MTANETWFAEHHPALAEVPRSETTIIVDDVVTFLRRFVVLSASQADALALWVAHTWALDAAEATPYIAITSAEKRSGKTRLLETLELLVWSPLSTANISDAALFRAIGGDETPTPTLLFDEVDTVFGPKARDREDLRGLLNAGYRRGAVVLRMGGAKMTTLETYSVFCAKALSGIGELPDTVTDRSIPIRLQRRRRDEHVERFRRREVETEAADLRARLQDWLEPQLDHLHGIRPALPDELDDRGQDVWEPLLALADLAGGDWPQRARTAALELSTGSERDEGDSLTTKLIKDIYTVFTESGEPRLRTSDLIDHLGRIEESPWGDWKGKPITAQTLSRLLAPWRIKTMPVWAHGETVRGYKLEQFDDAFARLLPETSVRSVGGVRSNPSTGSGTNAANAPNAHSAHARPLVGEDGYEDVIKAAWANSQLTLTECIQLMRLNTFVATSWGTQQEAVAA